MAGNSIQDLAEMLIKLGASDARIINARSIVVEDRFADMCKPPQCSNYGLAPSCPPHVMKPAEFRKLLARYEHALVFKIDAPTSMLMDDNNRDVARLVHEMSSFIERLAKERGYIESKGLAAGSCKRIFCHDQAQCTVLQGDGTCQFEKIVRPSISGFGINFRELCKSAGWTTHTITQTTDPADVPMGVMAGIVLIG